MFLFKEPSSVCLLQCVSPIVKNTNNHKERRNTFFQPSTVTLDTSR